MKDMKQTRHSIIALVVLWGISIILCGACRKQEPARLTISVDGKELSDAFILVGDHYVGSLTQTVISSDGKIYINGIFAARTSGPASNQEVNIYSGCSDTMTLPSGRHALMLGKGVDKNLQIDVDVSPGHHLLIYLPDKDLVKWDNKSFPVGPNRKVSISSE